MASARDVTSSPSRFGLKGCAGGEHDNFGSTKPPQPSHNLIALAVFADQPDKAPLRGAEPHARAIHQAMETRRRTE
jgi:hypothetical protein